jgi:hypothetical protein
MAWKQCSVIDERMQFVARRLAGEAMAELCRTFDLQVWVLPCKRPIAERKVSYFDPKASTFTWRAFTTKNVMERRVPSSATAISI